MIQALSGFQSNKGKIMEYEIHWDSEMVVENDEHIAKMEADIHEEKALLKILSEGEELFFY
jgi:hypothetical protein